jgi:hypothetical protein
MVGRLGTRGGRENGGRREMGMAIKVKYKETLWPWNCSLTMEPTQG